ncbi:Hsp20/alpha crystallin family protein [Robertmurraya korlensis]|uniref:Hsp20/alpha crystallin family protein n=1 Tax=Robertmurraya korlensis TaxID=519977 RepID=UPI00203BD6FE|nr:Hsp20/alpha crystallin family protein [Robertmurraya korlensis]MCM3599934.1 Hsp20/alpha crystallin family protein [Robertmurraya korlensis]
MFFNYDSNLESSWRKEAESAMKWTMELQQKTFPRCDLYEEDEGFILEAEIPGIEIADIHVKLENNVCIISGTCQTMKAGIRYHLKERPHLTFEKRITLPSHITKEGIRYSLTDGLLTITLPKENEEVVLVIQRED